MQLSASAARAFRKLEPLARRRLARVIDALAIEPRPPNARKLEGERNLYHVRAGDYRVIYAICDRVLVVLVIAIDHRRHMYRR